MRERERERALFMLQFINFILIFFRMESDTINCEGNGKENEEENKETV